MAVTARSRVSGPERCQFEGRGLTVVDVQCTHAQWDTEGGPQSYIALGRGDKRANRNNDSHYKIGPERVAWFTQTRERMIDVNGVRANPRQ